MQGQNNVNSYKQYCCFHCVPFSKVRGLLTAFTTTLLLPFIIGCGSSVTTSFEPKKDAKGECAVYDNQEFNATLNTNGELTISTESEK